MNRGVLVAIAAAAFALLVILALAVASGPLAIDLSAASALAPLHAGAAGALIDGLDVLGQALVWDPLVGLVAVALWLRGRRVEAVLLVGGVVLGEAGASAAKLIVNRVRPPGVVVVDLITQASFPSGHVTRTVVACGLLAWFGARSTSASVPVVAAAGLAAVAFSILMGVARVAAGEHWLTDVVGAALLGVVVLAVVGLVAPLVAPLVQRLADDVPRPRAR